VLTDLLLNFDGHDLLPHWLHSNYVPSIAAYRNIVAQTGFRHLALTDITEAGVRSYVAHMSAQIDTDKLAGRCTDEQHATARDLLLTIDQAHEHNLICRAVK
jgi:hypothetical protein